MSNNCLVRCVGNESDEKWRREQCKVLRRFLKTSSIGRRIIRNYYRHGRRGAFYKIDKTNFRPSKVILQRLKMKDKERGSVAECSPEEGVPQWKSLPHELLLKIFQFLSLEQLMKASEVCKVWNSVGQDLVLWKNVEINVGVSEDSTSQDLIQFILDKHGRHLKSVVLKADSTKESAEKVCEILKKLVNCSLKKLSVISCATPVFFDIDHELFTSALSVLLNHTDDMRSLAVDYTPIDDPSLQILAKNHAKTLQLLKMKSCPMVSPEGVLALADNCRRLRELSLNYTLLTDDIIRSLSSENHVRLTHLRIDIFSDHKIKQKKKISTPSWKALIDHSPNLNLIMYFFVTDVETYDHFFHSYNPVSHVYFCEYVPKNVLQRISRNCPRVTELVVNGTDGPNIDDELIDLGLQCDKLTSIGLSECYVNCSAFVEFVRISCKRLSELFISEDCLLQSLEYDLQKVILNVSELLSTYWEPEFTPLW